MYQAMAQHADTMNAAAQAEAGFSCASHTAMIMDANILASILFSLLRLRGLIGLLLLGKEKRLKDAPAFA
ncbi:MAG: hypothetical protein IJZ66_05530 [Oscillibacter sp.]|nr:hypothetical protein [Oscillibacter sp.]MBQ8851883.1 hypothetical protein [Oscillibacter sp.]